MLNNQEKQRILNWYDKFCYKNKIDYDLFDIEAEIDSNISYDENLTILEKKLKTFMDNGEFMQEQIKKEKQRKEHNSVNVDNSFLHKIFNKPKIIGFCANTNEGKTNTLYYFLDYLNQRYKFNVYTYGLRINYENTIKIHSVEELEQIKDSFVIIDEMFTLFDMDNRKIKRQIENTIRLIFHNNNTLLLCGLGENFKKFLSAKLHIVIFKKITYRDLINGSTIKYIIMNYKGSESGSTMINLDIDKAIIWDGKHYNRLDIPYLSQYDSKKKNVPIFVPKNDKKQNI